MGLRFDNAEAANFFVVLLVEDLASALPAADATLEEVRTEFFLAIVSPPSGYGWGGAYGRTVKVFNLYMDILT